MVTEAVDALLATLPLDERGLADAEVARVLAAHLDSAEEGSASVAGLARELRATLNGLAGGERAGFVAELFEDER